MSDDLGRVLVLGGDGMLGRAWTELLSKQGVEHDVAHRDRIDLGSARSITAFDFGAFHLVINCAAWTDVDGAEEHEGEATRTNGEGVGNLAAAVRDADGLLVHYGTDYVFQGQGSRPWPVDAPLQPLNAYGRSKAVGEVRLRGSGCPHLLLRTSWLYAPWGNNFVRTMARLGKERETLRVVDDQRGRPTSAEHLARTSLALLRAGARGTLHVTDGGECTWFELARHVVGLVNPACVVEPCTTEEFPRPAPRPAYSVLDLGPTEGLVGPMPPWQDNVTDVVQRLQ